MELLTFLVETRPPRLSRRTQNSLVAGVLRLTLGRYRHMVLPKVEGDGEFTNEEASDRTCRVDCTLGCKRCGSEGQHLHRRNLRPVLREGEFPRNDDEAA